MKKACLKIIAGAVAALGLLVLCGTEKGTAAEFKYDEMTAKTLTEVRLSMMPHAEDEQIRYYSSNKEVATVSKTGKVMSFSEGSCLITAVGEDDPVEESSLILTVADEPEYKQIALTFDDGPGEYAGELMDFLAEKGAKVTFFLIGSDVPRRADTVKRMYEEGHEIGNHSYSHACLSTLKESKIEEELTKANNAVFDACGAYPTVMRPPYGSKNETVASAARTCGLPQILWSVDTLDWKYRVADRVKQQVIDGAKDGNIILVHEIHRTTIDGVKMALEELCADGWQFVCVSDLLERDGAVLSPGSVYNKKKNR